MGTTNGAKGLLQESDQYKRNVIKLTAKTFFNYHDCKLCHYPHIHNLKNYTNHGCEVFTEISSPHISKNHHCAKTIGVIKICISNDLSERVYEMINISTACRICKEYFIALKLLRCAFR